MSKEQNLMMFLLLCFAQNIIGQSNQTTDANALQAVKAGFSEYGTANLSSWDSSQFPCTDGWDGVACAQNRVVELVLCCGITGKISSAIGLLSSLQILELGDYTYGVSNYLSGQIPTTMGLLVNLYFLDLSVNTLSGTIPSELGLLLLLYYLNLGGNRLKSTIPTELTHLSRLKILVLSENALSGKIPSSIYLMTNLEQLSIFENDIEGTISTNLGHFVQMQAPFFCNNVLTGKIPSEIGLLSSVTNLQICNNELTGSIPSEIGKLTNLQQIYINNNRLSGNIPSELGLLQDLEILLLFLNELSGRISSDFGMLTSLQYLNLDGNEITGAIPTEMYLLTNIIYLIVGVNSLNGFLSSEIGLFANLQMFDISHNSMIGTIPTEIGLLSQLSVLDLNYNFFSGTLPSEIGNIGVSHGGLAKFAIFGNLLSGRIPSEIVKTIYSLQTFHIYDNIFTGVLPSELGLLFWLTEIRMYYNSFSGTLPSGWSNLENLKTFYVQENRFNDSLPITWSNLTSLNYLDIINSGLDCSLPICNVVSFWNTKPNADSMLITPQPTSSRSSNGAIGITPIILVCNYTNCAQQICGCTSYGCCDSCESAQYAILVDFPSYVITATVTPSSLIRNLTGYSVGSVEGFATFSSLQFIGQPNVTYTITFTSPGLRPMTSNPIYVPSCSERRLHSSQDPSDPFSCICDIGYYFDSAISSCLPCPLNTYKNVSSANEDLYQIESCVSCPPFTDTNSRTAQTNVLSCMCIPGYYPISDSEHAGLEPICASCSLLGVGVEECLGGNWTLSSPIARSGVKAAPGYWITTDTTYFHPNDDTWFIISQCPFDENGCPGGASAELCSPGYQGPACGVCAERYGLEGTQCQRCPSEAESAGLFAFALILIIAGCVIYVWITTGKEEKEGSLPERLTIGKYEITLSATITKYFAWFQEKKRIIDLTGVKITIAHFQLLGSLLSFSTNFPSSITRAASIPTAMASISVNANNIVTNCAVSPSLYMKASIFFFEPIILCGGVVIGYIVLHLSTSMPVFDESYWLKVTRGCTALLYIAHPGIIQGLISSLVCVDVGTQSYVLKDMRVNCKSSSFIALKICAILYLILYGIGWFVYIFFTIKRNPESFTFLTEGYEKKYYYWDLIRTIRSISFSIIALFASAPLQLFFASWILMLSFESLRTFNPYEKEEEAITERVSYAVLIFTLSIGTLYFSDTIKPNSPGDITAVVFIIIVNASAAIWFLIKYSKREKKDIEMQKR